MIKGVLIDYGGTIDTNGLHWGGVIGKAYEKAGLIVDQELYNKAYSFGERTMALHPIIQPEHNFLETIRLKVEQQFRFLAENGVVLPTEKIEEIAIICNQVASDTILAARPTLERLVKEYPTILVSNFYGNLNSVLEAYGIRHLFLDVVESAVVGVRKPDAAIYQLGADRLGLSPSQCVVIGDSYTKDIVPGATIGCKTVWINVEGWEESDSVSQPVKASAVITDFADVLDAIKTLS